MPFSLINEANFFVVMIALLVVFFLLGLLSGRLIGRQKKASKEKNKDTPDEESEASGQTDTLGQDNRDSIDSQSSGQSQRPYNYKTRYHNNYW